MKIYTKTGDGGETGLFGGGRVSKDELRVEAYGEVDELSAAIGAARAAGPDPEIEGHLLRVQDQLLCIGAELASPPGAKTRGSLPPVDAAWTSALEAAMDRWDSQLPPLRNFLLPGGGAVGAALHLARCVCRRAERRVVSLHRQAPVDAKVLAYLNRLSDFLFMAARVSNLREQVPEHVWEPARRQT